MNIQQAAAKLSQELRWEFATVLRINKDGTKNVYTARHWTRYCAYIPFVSIPFAVKKIRDLIQETRVILASSSGAQHFLNEPLSSSKSIIGRKIRQCLSECIPFYGNFVSFCIDQQKIYAQEKKLKEEVPTSLLTFSDGKDYCEPQLLPQNWNGDYSGIVNQYIESRKPSSKET